MMSTRGRNQQQGTEMKNETDTNVNANKTINKASTESNKTGLMLPQMIPTKPSPDSFVVPSKCIKEEHRDLPYFQDSEAYARILSYILALNTAVSNRKISDPITESAVRTCIIIIITYLYN